MDFRSLPHRVARLTARSAEPLSIVADRLAGVLRDEGATQPPEDLAPTILEAQLRELRHTTPTRRPLPSHAIGVAESQQAAVSRLQRAFLDNAPLVVPEDQLCMETKRHAPAPDVVPDADRHRQTPDTTDDPTVQAALDALAPVFAAIDAPYLLMLPTAGGHFLAPHWGTLPGTYCTAPSTETSQRTACEVLAQATALLGVPVTITNHDLQRPSLWTEAMLALTEWDVTVSSVPVYRWQRGTDQPRATLCAVIISATDHIHPPLGMQAWGHLLLRSAEWPATESFAALSQATQIDDLPATHADRCSTWHAQIEVMDHDHPLWLPPPPRDALTTFPDGSEEHATELVRWQSGLIRQCGIPLAPSTLHPDTLKEELQTLMAHAEVEQWSATTERNSRSMSQSAWKEPYTESTKQLLKEVYTQLKTEHLLFTLFGRYQSWRNDFLVEGIPADFSPVACCACRLLVQQGMLHEGPRFVGPQETPNPLYTHIRRMLEAEAAFLSVPVFDWGQSDADPRFEGIFLLVSDPTTPVPSRVQWLQQLFVCQIMHDPVGVIGQRMDRDEVMQEMLLEANRQVFARWALSR